MIEEDKKKEVLTRTEGYFLPIEPGTKVKVVGWYKGVPIIQQEDSVDERGI